MRVKRDIHKTELYVALDLVSKYTNNLAHFERRIFYLS